VSTASLSAEELEALCFTGEERFAAALESGPDAGWEAFAEIENARRTTCNRYLGWVALEEEYVLETFGHEAHRELIRPERVVELALRSGLGLADLAQIQDVCCSADNPVADRMRRALEGSDAEPALGVWHESERILRAAHDLRRDLISDRLGQIYRRFGLGALEDAMFYAAQRGWWSVSMPADFALDPAVRLRNLTFFLTVCAYFRLRIEAEPERWVLHVDECGRCGRQCRDRYFTDGWGLEVIEESVPATFGRGSMTAYQTHAAVMHHMFAIDTVGAPWPVFDCQGLRKDPSGCRLYVYPDPADTPDEFYEQVGRQRVISAR